MNNYATAAKARLPPVLTVVVVPAIDGEVVVARDGDDGRLRRLRLRVGGDMRDRRVGQKLHDHADVLVQGREHLRRLCDDNTPRYHTVHQTQQ